MHGDADGGDNQVRQAGRYWSGTERLAVGAAGGLRQGLAATRLLPGGVGGVREGRDAVLSTGVGQDVNDGRLLRCLVRADGTKLDQSLARTPAWRC
jgi:hypothetical protein